MIKTIDDIKEKLKQSQHFYNDYFRRAAILIPIIEIHGKLHVLFEVRAKHLNTQPSEICFPGGKIEDREHPEEAAIRETCEELNLFSDNIRVLSKLNTLHTPFNMLIEPYVGIIEGINYEDIKWSHDEVEEIFAVPLDYLLAYSVQSYQIDTHFNIPESFPYHKIQYGKEYKWKSGSYEVLFYEYEDYIIWGITAKILRTFINIIK